MNQSGHIVDINQTSPFNIDHGSIVPIPMFPSNFKGSNSVNATYQITTQTQPRNHSKHHQLRILRATTPSTNISSPNLIIAEWNQKTDNTFYRQRTQAN
jgi:hypothetical protein